MGFIDNLKRAWAKSGEDDLGILAAGVSYYAFLALVPSLTAAVLGYGLIADPATVAGHIASLADRLPASVAELIGEQLQSMVETSGGVKGLGLLLSLGLALFGARTGAATLVRAIAIALDAEEKRGLVRGNVVALLVLVCALVAAGIVAGSLALTAYLFNALPDAAVLLRSGAQIANYTVLAGLTAGAVALLYRHAVPGHRIAWRRLRGGAIFAGLGFVLFTALFGFYVANFGSYNATYGSLGAVVVLLTWLYLTAYVLLFGAEIVATHAETTPDIARQ